ncbi:MAG: hypothetical protein M5R38_11160 [Candidatus Methylomirabilis sp.]|nr:hypothetical protein [Candidatus Methylomirabilis sp.]
MREAGFDNINLDLMFGLPDQSTDDWSETLDWAIGAGPEHISAYGLILEDGTPLQLESSRGDIGLPDEETEAAMYRLAVDRLREAGFEQYEISNFARQGFQCRHNLVYWQHQEYLGLGAGAHSFLAGRRYYNESLPARYVCAMAERGAAVAGGEVLSVEMVRSERLMLGLRLRSDWTCRRSRTSWVFKTLRRLIGSLAFWTMGFFAYGKGGYRSQSVGFS